MNIKDLKISQLVVDKWYSKNTYNQDWGIGKVLKIKKTRFHIFFENAGLKVYDATHIRNFVLAYKSLSKDDKKEYSSIKTKKFYRADEIFKLSQDNKITFKIRAFKGRKSINKKEFLQNWKNENPFQNHNQLYKLLEINGISFI